MKEKKKSNKIIRILNNILIFSMPIMLLTVNIKTNTISSSIETKNLATSFLSKVEDVSAKETIIEETPKEEKVPEPIIVKKPVVEEVKTEEIKTEKDYQEVREQMAASVPTPPPITQPVEKKYLLGLKFTGNMSGYGPWQDKENKWHLTVTSTGHNLLTQGVYTNDSTYGRVRIVAGDTEIDEKRYYILPTYSIIKCTLSDGSSFNVKVMDRGDKYIGRGKKFEFDLAYENESQAKTLTNVSFEVLRMGP